jgi:hypothetical protein
VDDDDDDDGSVCSVLERIKSQFWRQTMKH